MREFAYNDVTEVVRLTGADHDAMTQTADVTLEPTPPDVKRYQRLKLTASLASLAVTLAVVASAALFFGPALDRRIADVVGESPWLRLLALAAAYGLILEILTLPFGFWSGYVLEHRFGLSNQTFGRWLGRLLKGYLVGAPLALVLLFGFYGLLRWSGPWWWAWAAAAWLGVSLVLGQLLPVVVLPLFYKVTRLDDSALLERFRRLTDGTGLTVEGVYRLDLSADTKKANAALAGLGRTRRVLLGDTLLAEFTPDEIEVVFAHEVGHHVHRHLPKMIIGSVVLSAAGFWVVDAVLRHAAEPLGYRAFDDAGALPLVMLALSLFALVLSPLQHAVSRHFERQCDRYALERTGLRMAYRSAFVKLARLNKADADPHKATVWMFDDHPPIRERLALAE